MIKITSPSDVHFLPDNTRLYADTSNHGADVAPWVTVTWRDETGKLCSANPGMSKLTIEYIENNA